MKKNILAFALALCLGTAYAQSPCVPDGSITEPGIYPDTIVNLPHAYGGVAYSTVIQINVFTDTSSGGLPVTVDDITLDNVTGLPPGFTYTCNPSNCVFPAGQTKCLTLAGNPTLAQAGTYNLTINVTLHGRLFGVAAVSQASQVLGYKIKINGSPSSQFSGTPLSVCTGGYVNYTDQSTNEPTAWLWTFQGGTPNTSTLQTPPAIKYSGSGKKKVTLKVTSPAGTNTLVKNSYVEVNALPVATITPAGSTTVCSPATVTLNATTSTGVTYQWIKGTNDIAGATGSSYVAATGGNYKVRVTRTSSGCQRTSAVVAVSVSVVTATVTANGPLTFCAGQSVTLTANAGTGLTYQWMKGANNIAGATGISYVATTGGKYKVKVTNANGCTKISGVKNVVVNCREGGVASVAADENEVAIYPNPVTSVANLDVELAQTSTVNITLIDVTGKLVANVASGTFEEGTQTFTYDATALTRGIYFAVINIGDKKITKKLVVN